MTQKNDRLLLVYNADGGIISMVKDAVHKLVSPDTYPCSLCAITYGPVSMRADWSRFLKSLPLDIVFHYKDDFAQAYPGHETALPAILIATEDAPPRLLVSASELDALNDQIQLMQLVTDRIEQEHAGASQAQIMA